MNEFVPLLVQFGVPGLVVVVACGSLTAGSSSASRRESCASEGVRGMGDRMAGIVRGGDGTQLAPMVAVVPVLKELRPGVLSVVGTGFYVTRYGLFATAAHVLKEFLDTATGRPARGFVMEDQDGERLVFRRILTMTYSHVADVGLGQAENNGPVNRFPTLSLSRPDIGEPLVTYAYPENTPLDFTDPANPPTLTGDFFRGEFCEEIPPSSRPFIPCPHYETTVEIRSGASGCPIFNSRGRVVGISCRGWDFRGSEHEGNNLSAILPITYLLSLNSTCAAPPQGSWEWERIPESRRGAALSFGELVAYNHIDCGTFPRKRRASA